MNTTTNNHALPVLEEFYSIQGEGAKMGEAAYFIRLGGCDIGCEWCDSKFSWNPENLESISIDRMLQRAEQVPASTLLVTGGEPLLYNLDPLCHLFKSYAYQLYLETSGAYPLSGTWDWFCLSPKRQKPPLNENIELADELKIIVYEQADFEWAEFMSKRVSASTRLFIQPEWSVYTDMLPTIVSYIKQNPQWRISLQAHKLMGIP